MTPPDPTPPETQSPPGHLESRAQAWAYPLFARYVRFAGRYPGLLLLAFFASALLSLVPISQLELHTDLAELLPDNHPAVQALRRTTPRQISSTNLVLILESPDPAANRRFAEALRPELSKMIGTVFSEIQWRPDTEVPDYARRWQWLYVGLDELRAAESLMDRVVAKRTSPLMVDLEGDPEEELKQLQDKIEKKLPVRNDSSYFEFQPRAIPEHKDYKDKSLHYLGVMLWRRSAGLATTGDQQTLHVVEQLIARMNPQKFHPKMAVEYSGGIAMAIDEHNAVREDLSKATAVCLFLVLASIYLYFRRFAVLVVVGAPAILGVLMSLVLARYTIQHLNANTAFLISIILGNGINTPIILLGRYGEERRRGQAVPEALATAMAATLIATTAATAAASISYGCLLATSLRGLNQFGLVGGAGMLMAWSISFLLVPPLVLFGERLRPGVLTPKPALWQGPFALLGRMAQRRPRGMLFVTVLLVAAAAFPAVRYLRDPMEYNFNNLRTNNPQTAHRWDIMYQLGLGNVGAGYIARDGVILVDAPEQADPVAEALLAQDRALGNKSVVEAVRTLNKVLPDKQDEKLEVLARIRKTIDKHRELLGESEWKQIESFRPPEYLRRLKVPDLPRRLRENFTEVDGTIGRFVGIDADPGRYIEGDGRELIRLSKSLQVTTLGKTWVAAAASTVFAGMLEVIIQDAPKVSIYAVLGVSLLTLVAFGIRGAPFVLTSLAIGLVWLFGLLGVLQWKLNFLNFVAVPITLGVGADYAANIWARISSEGTKDFGSILGGTGSAVMLCSITTIIGYSSLLLASNRALQSFGKIAVLGEVTCLLAALLALPAMALLLLGRGRAGRGEP